MTHTTTSRELSSNGRQALAEIAERTGFSVEAVRSMLDALIAGQGAMAQFNHSEFGGHGQWMSGGMTMVSDLFNHQLKGRVDALCVALAGLIAEQPELARGGSFQSQSQGHGAALASQSQQAWQASAEVAEAKRQAGREDIKSASLFVPGASGNWWPADLRAPNSTGAQNGARYAYFAPARRLAIELHGRTTVYDTLDHRIHGFSQQQSGHGSLSFNSQHGLVDVASLPVVSGEGAPRQAAPKTAPVPGHAPAAESLDIFATIEKLAGLQAKGHLSAEEFAAKKAELLGRL